MARNGTLVLSYTPANATVIFSGQLVSAGRYPMRVGQYPWTASAAGYVSKNGTTTILAGRTSTLKIALSISQVTGLSGVITDSSGVAIAGAQVILGANQVITGADGKYSFTNLAAGAGVLTVSASGYQEAQMSITINSGANTKNVQLTPVSQASTFGYNSGVAGYGEKANRIDFTRVQNTALTGILTGLEILFNQAAGAGNIRLGIYSDNNGSVGSLLLDAGQVAAGAGWTGIYNLNLPVTLSAYYWIAVCMSASNTIEYTTGGAHAADESFAYGPLPVNPPITMTNTTPYVMRGIVIPGGQVPPTVATNPASNVGSNGGTLNGNLSSLGTSTSVAVSFDYGLTTGYGTSTTPVSLTSPGSFVAALSGLTPGTGYHFRAKAVAGTVTVYGADQTFTTTTPPPSGVQGGTYGLLSPSSDNLWYLAIAQKFNQIFARFSKPWIWAQPQYNAGYSADVSAIAAAVKNNGGRIILRCYFWDDYAIYSKIQMDSSTGYPIQGWTDLKTYNLYQEAANYMAIQINACGVANLEAVTMSEEEPQLGWDDGKYTPNVADFIYGQNILYGLLKGMFPTLKIVANPHSLGLFTDAQVLSMSMDALECHSYESNLFTLQTYIARGVSLAAQKGVEFFTTVYGGTSYASDPSGALTYVAQAIAAAKAAGANNIAVYAANECNGGPQIGQSGNMFFGTYPSGLTTNPAVDPLQHQQANLAAIAGM